MKALRAILTFGLVAAAGCGGQAREEYAREQAKTEPSHVVEQNGEVGVSLDSATIARIGLHTAVLAPARHGAELRLSGLIVPDPQGTTVLRAPVTGRLAAIDGRSWPAFGERVDAGQEIAQVSDARPLAVTRGGTVLRVLAQPGEIVQAGQELLEISDFEHPLAQVPWLEGAPSRPPASLLLTPLGESGPRVRAALVGPSPDADPLTHRPAYLYRVAEAWPEARPGAAVDALLPDLRAGRGGLLLPAGAVVQWDGLAWAYVERASGRYVRVRVSTEHPVPGGWIVSSGFAPGEHVVLQGAEQLLSEEFRARITVGEEVGE